MSYTWKTEMRDDDKPLGDGLYGQAAMGWLGKGRVQLTVMPAPGTFPAECVISVDDARALAHAILDADRRVWPRLTDPPETVQVVRQTGGNHTVWTRQSLRFWATKSYPNGVSWAQVLRWGEVEDITDETQGGGS